MDNGTSLCLRKGGYWKSWKINKNFIRIIQYRTSNILKCYELKLKYWLALV